MNNTNFKIGSSLGLVAPVFFVLKRSSRKGQRIFLKKLNSYYLLTKENI
jgi:hypothetical protein